MLTPEQITDVIDEYRRTRSPFKVATTLGLNVAEVWAAIDANPDSAFQSREHSGGEGREDLRPYFIARARCSEKWDNDDPAIVLARDKFCAGTHTMATHRDGAVKFLCLIPLKRRVPANPDYFKPEVQL